jgi:hypothetical protein
MNTIEWKLNSVEVNDMLPAISRGVNYVCNGWNYYVAPIRPLKMKVPSTTFILVVSS